MNIDKNIILHYFLWSYNNNMYFVEEEEKNNDDEKDNKNTR